MVLQCDVCGFVVRYTRAMAPVGEPCTACGDGRMRHSNAAQGFEIANGDLVSINLNVPAYQRIISGNMVHTNLLDFFWDKKYRKLIHDETVFAGMYTHIWVPDEELFAWLVPYTGNRHNRTHFAQLLLATVARRKFLANGGVFPRLIEPFIGSGQVFLNACEWGPAFNGGIPLFREVIGGDLNPYVIRVYEKLAGPNPGAAIAEYLTIAQAWDADQTTGFNGAVGYMNTPGRHNQANGNPAVAWKSAMCYIYAVNRCNHGSKVTDQGVFTAGIKDYTATQLAAIRTREQQTLTAMAAKLQGLKFSAAHRDFKLTCALAKPTDIVFMDCPFPNFTKQIPPDKMKRPELYGTEAAMTYGVGDDGPTLQMEIVDAAKALVAQGTTVIICNFANPGLVRAYAGLVGNQVDPKNLRYFTYTFRSPSRQSEAYQVTVLPGHNAFQVLDVPFIIQPLWKVAGGDDNFGQAQEYFEEVASESDEETRADDAKERKRLEDQEEFMVDEEENPSDFEMPVDAVDDWHTLKHSSQ